MPDRQNQIEHSRSGMEPRPYKFLPFLNPKPYNLNPAEGRRGGYIAILSSAVFHRSSRGGSSLLAQRSKRAGGHPRTPISTGRIDLCPSSRTSCALPYNPPNRSAEPSSRSRTRKKELGIREIKDFFRCYYVRGFAPGVAPCFRFMPTCLCGSVLFYRCETYSFVPY